MSRLQTCKSLPVKLIIYTGLLFNLGNSRISRFHYLNFYLTEVWGDLVGLGDQCL